VNLNLAAFLLDAQGIRATDFDHAAGDRLRFEAGPPEVGAEVVRQRRLA
jgi:hypothetical protein